MAVCRALCAVALGGCCGAARRIDGRTPVCSRKAERPRSPSDDYNYFFYRREPAYDGYRFRRRDLVGPGWGVAPTRPDRRTSEHWRPSPGSTTLKPQAATRAAAPAPPALTSDPIQSAQQTRRSTFTAGPENRTYASGNAERNCHLRWRSGPERHRTADDRSARVVAVAGYNRSGREIGAGPTRPPGARSR